MRKSISLILAIVMIAMVFATIPFSAFAAEETTPPAVSDDDVVAEIVVGETTTPVKRSEFVSKFTSFPADADTTINILMDVDAGAGQLQFKPAANVTITINGDKDGDGKNAVITGSEKDNPTIRTHGPGKVVFNKIDYVKTTNSAMQFYAGSIVEIVDSNWTAQNGNIFAPSGAANSVITVKGNSTITTPKALVYTGWLGSAATINLEAGVTVTANSGLITKGAKTQSALTVNVNGATVFAGYDIGETDAIVNLNSGTLIGTVTGGTTTTAEGFKIVEKAAASIGNAVYATLDDAFAAAAAATEDITIKILSDCSFATTKTLAPTANVTIDGDIGGTSAKVTVTGGGNGIRWNADGKTLTFKNLVIDADCSGGCFLQQGQNGVANDVVFKNVDITAKVKWYGMNTMNNSGKASNFVFEDSTATITGGNYFYSTGNANDHKHHSVIDIKNSTINATGFVQVNGGSTAAINVEASNLTSTLNQGFELGTPTGLHAEAVATKTTLNVDGITVMTVPAGKDVVRYDSTSADISVNVESELPETVIAQVIGADGAIKATLTDIANLAAFFAEAGDGDTIKLYQDITDNNNGGYNVRGSVTIDGNGKTITYNGTGGDADMFWFKNTESEYDPTSVTEIPEGKMDTITIKNLKFVSAAGGAFRYYNTNLVLGEGNEIDLSASSRQMAWPASRQLGGITITGGKYIGGGGYMFGVSNDNQTLTIEGGEFVSMKKGIIAIDGGKHTISGGTFTVPAEVEGAKLISINTAGGKATSNLTITGGKFNVANPLSVVLALRNSAVTVTVDGAEVEMYGNISFENNGNVINLTAGKLDGSLAPKDGIAATINKAEGFNHVNTAALPEVYYQEGTGTAEGLDFVTALDRAAASFDDVVITLNKNVTLSKAAVLPASEITVTIKGNGNTITAADGIGNVFQITGNGTTLAIENAKLTGNPIGVDKNKSSCFFQIKGDDAGVSLKDVTAHDINVMYHFINAMGNNGSAKYITFDNVTTKNINGTNASISALIQTGNRQKTTPGGDHTNYSVITIKNSNLEHWRRIIECSEGSTANVLIENSTLSILTEGDQSAIRIYPVMNLLGPDVMPQTTRVVTRNVTYNIPEGTAAIKYEAAANITVIEEGPDNIVAEVFVDGVADPIKIRRDEFAKFFSTDMSTNITDDEPLKGNSWTLKIYMDLEFNNDTQLLFNLNEGKEIIIDGDPNGTGVNAKITSNQGGNPLFRLRENSSGGKITFKNLDRWTSSTMMQVYTNMAEINFDNCVWETNTRGITVYGGTDTTVNFKAGTVFTSTADPIFFTGWGWTGGMITVEEGAKLVAPKILSMDGSANYTKIKLKVDGGEVVGDITVDDGIYMLLAGKWDGNIVVPADEEGYQIFLGTSVLGDEFVVTGTNDFAEEVIPETTPNQGGETTTVPGGETTTVPGGDVTTVPGGDVTTVPGGDVTTVPGGDVTTVPGGDVTTVPGGETTTAPAGDKPAEGCAGCGGFSIAATFLALICAAGAALVIKKK